MPGFDERAGYLVVVARDDDEVLLLGKVELRTPDVAALLHLK